MKKRHSVKVIKHIEKAKDSALCAVEIYNKPSVKFKSSGYITLMVMAWTSLFHAIFWEKKVKPFYKKKNGYNYERVDGDFKHWEINTCIKKYFKSDTNNPIRKNLEFFIPLRNKIEHRYFAELDATIFGECQAMLFNFDEILTTEFGSHQAIKESLSFALQMYHDSKAHVEAIKKNTDLKSVINFIEKYRSTISNDVFATGKYSFQAFLFQVANNPKKDSIPIRFFKWDNLSEEDKKRVNRYSAVFTKEKTNIVSSVVHTEQIISAFLSSKRISNSEALIYIDAACYESTKYLPLHYYIKISDLSISDIVQKINQSSSTKNHQKKNLIQLLQNPSLSDLRSGNLNTGTESASEISLMHNEIINQRIILDNYNNFKKIRIFQAVTHIENSSEIHDEIFKVLLEIYKQYNSLKPTEKTLLLKAIHYLDTLLFSST